MARPSIIMTAAICVLLAACGSGSTGPSQEEGGWQSYTISDYTFNWLAEGDSLNVKITGPTTGWIAVGFEPTSLMKDANLIIGYFESGTAHIRDDFGTGQVTHDADVNLGGTDNVTLVAGSESGGETTLEFRIPLNSGDQFDTVLVPGSSHTVVFAYGAPGADDFTSAHVWAQAASLTL
jgi:hypothetical protein